MLLKMARLEFAPFPPDARCCCDCANGENRGKAAGANVITCKVDGAATLRNWPGYCAHFSESGRGAKRRKAQTRKIGP